MSQQSAFLDKLVGIVNHIECISAMFISDFDWIYICKEVEYAMSSTTKVKQMAHLKQKQIGDNSCKAIIVDTLLETVRPLTQEELSDEIASLFHVLVSTDRINLLINALFRDGIILFDTEGHMEISPTKKAEFITARLQETSLRKTATSLWIDYIRQMQEVSSELEAFLSQALPIFLRSLFVKHGVSSYYSRIRT